MTPKFLRQLAIASVILWLAAASSFAAAVNVLQIEGDYNSNSSGIKEGLQYAPVNFAGAASTTTPDAYGIIYHALTATDPSINTESDHAKGVRNSLANADGPNNPVQNIYCLEADDFLQNYVKLASPNVNWSTANRPASLNSPTNRLLKVVNNSWNITYQNTAVDTDVIRRLDYMVQREDLAMFNAAVSPIPKTTIPAALVWSSRNGIAVRGTQAFDPTHGTGIGKTHADLWGPKTAQGGDALASYATPGVAGYAAALIDAADSQGWSNGQNGLRHEVVKSILMTGADKTDAALTTTLGGFTQSWVANTVNNLSTTDGAGRADLNTSLDILYGGPQTMAAVSGSTIATASPVTLSAAWAFESSLAANAKRAVVVDLTDKNLTQLTATLAWDVTQTEKPNNRLDTTSSGTISTNLNLELLPVTFDNGVYTLGSSLGITGLQSLSTDDNVEHLYISDTLQSFTAPPSGLYAFVITNNSSANWNFGYGFSYTYDFTAVPEPGTLCLLIVAAATCAFARFRRFSK